MYFLAVSNFDAICFTCDLYSLEASQSDDMLFEEQSVLANKVLALDKFLTANLKVIEKISSKAGFETKLDKDKIGSSVKFPELLAFARVRAP